MQEVKVDPQPYGAPAPPAAPGPGPAHISSNEPLYIQRIPTWVLVMRILQIVFSIILLGMAGYLMNGKVLESHAFTAAVVIFTWIVVGYALITEKVSTANKAYNIWAILSLDLFMTIMWLAALGANAATRASFKYDVNVGNCYDNGNAFNSKHCEVYRRALDKRADGFAVSGHVGLAVMSAVAGVSVLPFLFFLATLIFHGHTFRLDHQAKKASTSPAAVEAQAQQIPMLAQQSTPVAAQSSPAYGDYGAQVQTGYPAQVQTGYPAQTVSPVYGQVSPQSTGTPAPVGYELPNQAPTPVSYELPYQARTPAPIGYELPSQGPYQSAGAQPYPQQPYSPHGTPAPGQPYYPPQQ